MRTKETEAIVVLYYSIIICKPNTSSRIYAMRTYLFSVTIVYLL